MTRKTEMKLGGERARQKKYPTASGGRTIANLTPDSPPDRSNNWTRASESIINTAPQGQIPLNEDIRPKEAQEAAGSG